MDAAIQWIDGAYARTRSHMLYRVYLNEDLWANLLTALFVDLAVFLVCCLLRLGWHLHKKRWRVWQQFRRCICRRQCTDDTASGYRQLNVTESNYLLFLQTGRQLCLVLALISSPSIFYLFDSANLLGLDPQGKDLLPVFNGTSMPCTHSVPQNWSSYAVPSSNCTVSKMPRSLLDGDWNSSNLFAATGLTFFQCTAAARICDAHAIIYGSGACYLLDAAAASNATLEPSDDFRYCQESYEFRLGSYEFFIAILQGFVTIAFAFKFLMQVALRPAGRLQRHTLWITHLPARDRDDGSWFELSEDEFRRVTSDLRTELQKWVLRRWQQKFPDEPLTLEDQHNIIRDVYVVQAANRSTHMAGHAFAILSREVYLSLLLGNQRGMMPTWCHRRRYALFKFGIPPWASVTLYCKRAPVPADIEWSNLHVENRVVMSALLQIILFLFVLMLAVPDPDRVLVWVDDLWGLFGSDLSAESLQHIRYLLSKFPAYALLFVNAVIVPAMIEVISDAQRPDLRSQSHSMQFSSNLIFLLMVSVAVPILHLFMNGCQSIADQLVNFGSMIVSEVTDTSMSSLLENMRIRSMGLHTGTTLMSTYLINATLMTNGFQLIQFGIMCALFFTCGHFPALPTQFSWGYWYAWAVSMIGLILTASLSFPAILVVGVLFFHLTLLVHRSNFRNGIFYSYNMDALFESRVAIGTLRAVVFFWLASAWCFLTQPIVSTSKVMTVGWPHVDVIAGSPKVAITMPDDTDARFRLTGSCLLLALLTALALRFAMHDSSLERFVFRKIGAAGPDTVGKLLWVLLMAFLVIGFLSRPNFDLTFEPFDIYMQTVFAICLVIGSGFVGLLSMVVGCVERRRASFTSAPTLDDYSCLQYTQEDMLHDMEVQATEDGFTLKDFVDKSSVYQEAELRRRATRATVAEDSSTDDEDGFDTSEDESVSSSDDVGP
eukprot:TRINITY_DN15223_c0_g1_i1.p1 TRINITY_DN15223_c0_g1~~TRINITY_DN15223_c0_g1_i1.p1  ORF type:complete len:943 (-),score=54.18 TRINITY_DN15223_c0_g1_i1:151-2979(-)